MQTDGHHCSEFINRVLYLYFLCYPTYGYTVTIDIKSNMWAVWSQNKKQCEFAIHIYYSDLYICGSIDWKQDVFSCYNETSPSQEICTH